MVSNNIVIDAFPAFNEIELAAFRISYLSESVDLVVIAEAKLTHSGIEKPLYFKDWISGQSADLKSRVVVIEVPLANLESSWEREIFTREYLRDFLLREYPDSRIILSDLDEIPSIEQVNNLRSEFGIFHFHTPTFVRNVNWQLQDQHKDWARGVMCEVRLNVHPNGGRFVKDFPRIDGAPGAHFSWLQIDKNLMANKLQATAHTELNENFRTSESLIRYCNFYKIDHLGRSRAKGFGLFRIVYPLPKGILTEMSRIFPELVDSGTGTPNLVRRLLATCKLSAFVGDTVFSHKIRSHFDAEYYFSHRTKLTSFIIFAESLALILGIIKRLAKRLKNLPHFLTK
jgi:hypothetical protein